MATLTVNASLSGYVYGQNATYSTARTTATSTSGAFIVVGQNWSGAVYECQEGFIQFDTSALPDGATITGVTLKLYPSFDNSGTDFTINVLGFDWGASLTTADWRTPTQAAALTNYGSYATASGWSGGYKSITGNASFIAAINKTGMTYIMLVSSRWQAGNTPTGGEYVQPQNYDGANPPQLVIDYTGVTHVAAAALSAAATISPAAGLTFAPGAALAAAATLSPLATGEVLADTALAATGALAADGNIGTLLAASALVGSATLAAVAAPLVKNAAAALAASALLTASATRIAPIKTVSLGAGFTSSSRQHGGVAT